MPSVRYCLYFDGRPASREDLDRVDEITVEQEIDAACEARLKIPICTDAHGNWDGEDESFLRAFSRVRVEVKVGDRPYVALIDGPVVGNDRITSFEPGQSSVTLIVQDDSVYLNRDEDVQSFQNQSDHEIAGQVFNDTPQIRSQQIESSLPCTCAVTPQEIRRGTRMALLRRLARRQGMHAYVLPGEEPGQSVGCFRKVPTASDGLPEMVLLGPDRNIMTFNVSTDAQSPTNVQSFSLSLGDRTTAQATSRTRDVQLLGSEGALARDSDAGTRLTRPDADCCLEPERAAQIEAERASYAFEATGSVVCDCYGASLAPYRVVQVRAVGSRLSGDYVVKKVAHRLDRWRYVQEFTVMRNARSGGAAAALMDLAAGIF
jgi:hypothetical protein